MTLANNLGFTYTLSVNEKATQANLDKFIKKTLGGKDGLKIPIQLDVKSSLNLDQLKDIQKKINSTYRGKLNLNVKLKLDTDSISQTVLRNAQAKLNEQANRLFLNVDLKLSEQTMAKFGASLAIFKEVNRELEDMQKRLGSFNKKININIGTISGQEAYKDIEQSMSNIEGMTKDVNLSLQSQLDLHTKTLNTLKETLKTKAQEIDLAKAELEATKETNKLKENHKNTSKEINEKITALSKELNANKKIVDTYNKQKEALDKQAKAQKEVADITEQSQKRISELQAQQDDIQKSADLAKEESTRHQNNIDMTEAEIKVLKEKIKAMKEVKEEADTVISSKPTTKKQTAKQSETNATINNVKKVAEVATDTAKEVAKELNEVVKEEAKVAEQTVVAQEKVVESKAKANKEEQKTNKRTKNSKKKQNEITDAINTENIQIMITTKEMSKYEKEVYKNLVEQRGVLGDLKLDKEELARDDEEAIQRQKQYLQLLEKEMSLVLEVVGNSPKMQGSKSNVTGRDGTLKRYGVASKEDFEKLSEKNQQTVLKSEAHMTAENVKYRYARELLAEIKDLREKGIEDTELTNDLLDQQNEKLAKHKESRQAINEVQEENSVRKLMYPDAKSYVTEEMFGFTPDQLEDVLEKYEEKMYVKTKKGETKILDPGLIEDMAKRIEKLKASLEDNTDKDFITKTNEKIEKMVRQQTKFKELMNTYNQLGKILSKNSEEEVALETTTSEEVAEETVEVLSEQAMAMKEYCQQADTYISKRKLITNAVRQELGYLRADMDKFKDSTDEDVWEQFYNRMKDVQKQLNFTDEQMQSFYDKRKQKAKEDKAEQKASQEQREKDLLQMENYHATLSEQIKSFDRQSDMYKKCQDALAKYNKAVKSSTSDLVPILELMQKVSTEANVAIERKNAFGSMFARITGATTEETKTQDANKKQLETVEKVNKVEHDTLNVKKQQTAEIEKQVKEAIEFDEKLHKSKNSKFNNGILSDEIFARLESQIGSFINEKGRIEGSYVNAPKHIKEVSFNDYGLNDYSYSLSTEFSKFHKDYGVLVQKMEEINNLASSLKHASKSSRFKNLQEEIEDLEEKIHSDIGAMIRNLLSQSAKPFYDFKGEYIDVPNNVDRYTYPKTEADIKAEALKDLKIAHEARLEEIKAQQAREALLKSRAKNKEKSYASFEDSLKSIWGDEFGFYEDDRSQEARIQDIINLMKERSKTIEDVRQVDAEVAKLVEQQFKSTKQRNEETKETLKAEQELAKLKSNVSVKSNIEPIKVEEEFKSVAEKASEYLEDARKRLDKANELEKKANKLEQEEIHLYVKGDEEAHSKVRGELKATEDEMNKLLRSVNLEMKEAFKQIRDNMTEEQFAKYNVAGLDLKTSMVIAEQEVAKHFRERKGGEPLTPAIMKKMVEDAGVRSDYLSRAKHNRKELINEGKRKKDGARYSTTQEYKDLMDLSQKAIDRTYNEIYKTIANIAKRFEEAMAIAYDNLKAKEQQAKVEAQQPVKTETPIKVEAPVEVKPVKTEISKEEQTQSEEITKAKEKAIEQNKEDLALLEKQLAEKEQMLKTEREALNVSNDKVNASNEELKSLQQQESVEQAKIDKAKQVKVEKETVAQISEEEYNNAKETVATLQQQLIELKKLERANKKEKEKIESKVGDSREQEAKVKQLETEYKDVQKAIADTELAIESLTAKLAKQAEEAKETTYEIQRVTEETKKNQSQMSNALAPHESPRQESSGTSGSKGGSKGGSTKDGYRRDFAEELEYQQRSLALTIRQIEYKRNYSEIGEEVLNNIKAQVNALGMGTNSIKELRDRARDVNLEIKEAKFDLGIVDEDIKAFELLQESVQTQKQVYLNKLDTYEIGKLIAHTDSESLENIRQMVYALDDSVSSAEDLKRATQAINQSWTNMEHEAKVAKKFDDDWKQAIKYNEQLDRMTERERAVRKAVVDKSKAASIDLQQRHKQIELGGILNHLTEEQAERWRELGSRLVICADSMQEVTSRQKALNQEMNQFKIDAMVNKLKSQESIFSRLGASLKSLPAQYIGLNEAIQLVERSFQGAFERVKKLDSAYTNISMTMDVSKQAFETMRKTSVELGKQYGVMSGDILDMMKIYASAGTTAEEINAQMAGTIAMKNVTGMDSEAVTNSIQTILQQYKLLEDGAMSSAQAIQYAGDVMTSVSYNLAKEEADAMKEVVSAVETAGSVIYQAGGSLEWYSSVVGTLTEVMNASGSEIGNAMKMVSARILQNKQVLESLGESTENFEMETAQAEKALNSIGVSIRGEGGDLRDLEDILTDVAKEWTHLSDSSKQFLAEKMAGNNRRSYLVTLLENYSRVIELQAIAEQSEGAMAEASEKQAKSVEGRLNALKTTVDDFYDRILNSDTLKNGISVLDGSLRLVIKLADALDGKLIPAMVTLGAVATALKWQSVVDGFASIAKKSVDVGLTIAALVEKVWVAVGAFGALKLAMIGLGAGALAFGIGVVINKIQEQNEAIANAKKNVEELKTTIESFDTDVKLINQWKELNQQMEQGNLTVSEQARLEAEILRLKNELISRSETYASILSKETEEFEKQADAMLGMSEYEREKTIREKIKENSVSDFKKDGRTTDAMAYGLLVTEQQITDEKNKQLELEAKLANRNLSDRERNKLAKQYEKSVEKMNTLEEQLFNKKENFKEQMESGLALNELINLAEEEGIGTNEKRVGFTERALEVYNRLFNKVQNVNKAERETQSELEKLNAMSSGGETTKIEDLQVDNVRRLVSELRTLKGDSAEATEVLANLKAVFKDLPDDIDNVSDAITYLNDQLKNTQEVDMKGFNESYIKSLEGIREAKELLLSLEDATDVADMRKIFDSSIMADFNGSLMDTVAVQEHINSKIVELEARGLSAYVNLMGANEEFWNTADANSEDYFNNTIKNTSTWEAFTIDVNNNLSNIHATMIQAMGDNYQTYFKDVADAYNIDLSNCKDAAEARVQIEAQAAENIARIRQAMVDAFVDEQSNILKDLRAQGIDGLTSADPSPYTPTANNKAYLDAIAQIKKWKDEAIGALAQIGNFQNAVFNSASPKPTSTSSSKDKDKEKEVADLDLQIDRYYDLQDAIDDVNNELSKNQALQKNARGTKKAQLMKEEIELYKKQHKAIRDLIDEQKRAEQELAQYIAKAGGSFDENGDIKNRNKWLQGLQDQVNKLRGEAKEAKKAEVEALMAVIKQYEELHNKTLPNTQLQYEELYNTIYDLEKQHLEYVTDLQKDITSAYENEMKKRTEITKSELEKQKDLQSSQYEEENFERDLASEQRKLDEIQQQIDSARRDTSESGKLYLQQLMEEYAEQEKLINDLIRDREHELGQNRFDEEMDRADEELENALDPKNVADLVNQAIANGFITIGEEVVQLDNLMSSWLDETGDGLYAIGNLLKSEMIDNLQTIKGLMADIGILPALNTNVNGRQITTPTTPQSRGIAEFKPNHSVPNISIGNLMNVEGNVTEDVMPQVQSMIKQAEQSITTKISDALRFK